MTSFEIVRIVGKHWFRYYTWRNKINPRNSCTICIFCFDLIQKQKNQLILFLILMFLRYKLVMFGKRYKSLGYCLNKTEEFLFLNPNIGQLVKRLPKKCFPTLGQMRPREVMDWASRREIKPSSWLKFVKNQGSIRKFFWLINLLRQKIANWFAQSYTRFSVYWKIT